MEADDRTEAVNISSSKIPRHLLTFLQHAREGLEKWRNQKSQGMVGHRVDILQRLFDHGERYPSEKLSEKELVTEIMEIM